MIFNSNEIHICSGCNTTRHGIVWGVNSYASHCVHMVHNSLSILHVCAAEVLFKTKSLQKRMDETYLKRCTNNLHSNQKKRILCGTCVFIVRYFQAACSETHDLKGILSTLGIVRATSMDIDDTFKAGCRLTRCLLFQSRRHNTKPHLYHQLH